jgi:hypothetical protein
MEFHGKFHGIPWNLNSMDSIDFSMEFHKIFHEIVHGIPWNYETEVDGIPWNSSIDGI